MSEPPRLLLEVQRALAREHTARVAAERKNACGAVRELRLGRIIDGLHANIERLRQEKAEAYEMFPEPLRALLGEQWGDWTLRGAIRHLVSEEDA